MNALDLEYHDMQHLFNLLDSDSNGELTLEELLVGAPRIKGNASSIDVACIMLQLNRLEDLLGRGALGHLAPREASARDASAREASGGTSANGFSGQHSGKGHHIVTTSTTQSANSDMNGF